MMFDVFNLPSHARDLRIWTLVLVLTLLAWISTLHQAFGMFSASTPMFGTMGLSLGPFVLFWTMMMAAMMFPALAPTLSTRYVVLGRRSPESNAFGQLLVFVLGDER